jgi:hypothetical protein
MARRESQPRCWCGVLCVGKVAYDRSFVTLSVSQGVWVGVGEWVVVGLGVGVVVGVAVDVGAIVGVSVIVGEAKGVGVMEAVAVGGAVGEGVNLPVGGGTVGVGVLGNSTPVGRLLSIQNPTSATIKIPSPTQINQRRLHG